MFDIKQEIHQARDERETGDPAKALSMFLNIDKTMLKETQLLDYLGELGLTYWHLKKFDEAKKEFENMHDQAKTLNSLSYQALAMRHLSRPEFNQDNPSTAVDYAKKGRELAHSANRNDIAWFDHGVVTALIFSKAPAEDIKMWFEIEAEDLYTTSQNTKDEIAKWVWISGLLMDRGQVFESKADLYMALMIAEQFKLSRRKEQIEELITKFESK